MLTDSEVDALARNILIQTVAYIRRQGDSPFTNLRESGASGPIFSYVTNTQGEGDVLCEYAPLEAVKKIIRSCEAFCENFVVEVKDPVTGETKERMELIPQVRPRSVQNMAANATVRLIANFRVRLEDTLEEAVRDCSLIGAGWLASVEGRDLTKLTNDLWPVTANLVDEIDNAAQRVAGKKRAMLQGELGELSNLILERSRGRKPKTPGQRERDSREYAAKVEAAYRALRIEVGKPPTKVSVADRLGEGGINLKTGTDSRTNAFNLKLERLNVSYDQIAQKVEDELHNKF